MPTDPATVADVPVIQQFNAISWMVIVAYILFTTWLGHVMSGKQQTIRDFFIGGRQLPWWAVSGSIIATEISAVTLVSVPGFLWAATGNMNYAVIAIGNILGRIIVAVWFIPTYYERDIYSPYEYIGHQLGKAPQRTTSYLFMIGGMLAQGARVLLTAIILEVITGIDIYLSIWIVGFVAVSWTYMGGIVTVIWTDVIQFGIFLAAAVLMLVLTLLALGDAGISIADVWTAANEAGKTSWHHPHWWDLRESYTLTSGLIAATVVALAAYGTDQLLVQKAFCCRDARAARWAIISSCIGQGIMFICLGVGVAMWYFFQRSGLASANELAAIGNDPDRMVPVFLKYRVPSVLAGLIVAGVFAAAISSLEGILAALAEQTIAILRPLGLAGDDQARSIHISRMAVIAWGIVLCGVACLFQYSLGGDKKNPIIDLALGLANYTAGAILGIFLIAFLPRLSVRHAVVIPWAAGFSLACVFGIVQHAPWAGWVIAAAGVVGVVCALRFLPGVAGARVALATVIGVLVVAFLNLYQYESGGDMRYLTIGWPWRAPLGVVAAVVAAHALSLVMGEGKEAAQSAPGS